MGAGLVLVGAQLSSELASELGQAGAELGEILFLLLFSLFFASLGTSNVLDFAARCKQAADLPLAGGWL